MANQLKVILSAAIVTLIAGCGDTSTAPVTGVITLDGAPVFPARVTFTPQATEGSMEAGIMSSALTEPDGSYSIEAACIGDNVVGVMVLPADENSEEAEDQERPPIVGKAEKDRYSVTSGNNVIDIRLKPLPVQTNDGRRRRDDDDD